MESPWWHLQIFLKPTGFLFLSTVLINGLNGWVRMFNIQEALFGIHVSGNEEEKIEEGKCRKSEIRERSAEKIGFSSKIKKRGSKIKVK